MRLEDQAQIVVRLGIVGPQTQRLLETTLRLVETFLSRQHFAEIVMKFGAMGIELDSLADGFGGVVAAAALQQGDAQKMQRLGVARLRREDAPIQAPRLAERPA